MRRIFIIGPMSDVTGRPLENTYNIKGALEAIFRDRSNKMEIKVDVPEELYGADIPRDVFTAIDLSDLVIADISRRSPNVMYELAFAHALGISTVLIDIQEASSSASQPTKKDIFYLLMIEHFGPHPVCKKIFALSWSQLCAIGWRERVS